jgi:nicotinamide-nucleotide amidase
MKLPNDIATLAAETIQALTAKGLTVATAESCTGGLIAGALTAVAGSSAVVYGGFITYANEAKISQIGVPYALLKQHGAVSEQVAIAMAEGALGTAGTHIAIAVTGVAGPDGGTADKPVGLVHFALASDEETKHVKKVFPKLDRDGVRHATVVQALKMLRDFARA